MTLKKSRAFPINGESISFDNFNGKLIGINKKNANGLFQPIDNSSVEFNTFKDSEESLDAFRKSVYGSDKNSYPDSIEVASDEELTNYFAESQKKFNNEQFVQNEENPNALAFKRLQSNRSRINGNSSQSSQILAYPVGFDRNQDHLKITRHEYRRPDINQSKAGGNTMRQSNTPSGIPEYEFGAYGKDVSSTEYNTAGDTVAGKLLGSILLPMPKVADVNGVEWGKSELTISGLAALGTARALDLGGTLTGKNNEDRRADREMQNILQEGQSGTDIDGSAAMEGTRAVAAQTITSAANLAFGSNLDADTFLARTSGRVLNPNAEVLFQGPVIRDFSFSFVMIARSKDEGDEIRKIIRFLKLGMAPKFRSTAFLKNPDVFLLEYRSGDGVLKTVNRFNPGGLALQTMSVDYSPNGYWSAYRDSQPVQLKMDLSFTELRPIYQGDQEMTPADSVGY
tara:strand:+ start:42 stop:1406 length:1365 start_codon:yes stop_codon:yes gene_type:complete